ncbi:Uncharacterised protein [Streptococcus pneumoniae]|nr:Uncharacterised protein [Streptococcus pneumoniae]CKG58887.1 Uncharacterised protein [Streptococcus pneumoniae]
MAKTAKISTVFPIGEFFDRLNNGVTVAPIVLPFCLRNVKYAIVKATIAYSDHGKRPQWKNEYCIASLALSSVPAFPVSGSVKCEIGSAIP